MRPSHEARRGAYLPTWFVARPALGYVRALESNLAGILKRRRPPARCRHGTKANGRPKAAIWQGVARDRSRGLIVKRKRSVLGRPGSDLLSQGLSHSTIGAEEFNGRVRDGIGFKLLARTTRPAKDKETKQAIITRVYAWTLKMRAIKPIERLVPVSYTHYCASTPGLSTWSSSTVLKGELVSRWVSRLDAFSGYPVHT